MEQDPEEPELKSWEKALWWIYGVVAGGFIALPVWIATDSDTLLVASWILWLPCLWALWQIGFWQRLERFVRWLWLHVGWVLRAVGRLLEPVFIVFAGSIIGFARLLFIVLISGVAVFVALGIMGLLWFGVSQFF